MHAGKWTVEIFFSEDGSTTKARAVLSTREHAVRLEGYGESTTWPGDVSTAEIAVELAASRALASLAHRLNVTAAGDLEVVALPRQ